MWECFECECENDLDPSAAEGQIVTCDECGAEFEVLALDPLELGEPGEDVTDDTDTDDEPEVEVEVEVEADADADEDWESDG